ncbi:MAG: alpha-glucosidase/alpha-galactosidase [Lentisphaeria bacterium]|nr:alpha-glucosidase/alpha-galactosidase [Lentisphaeria bacterium]
MSIKVAFIGAGSLGFTRRLILDIVKVPELRDANFALHDISKQNLDMVTQIVKRDFKANKLTGKVTSSTVRRKALKDADYVINCTRIGGLDAFKSDIDIPLKYGVDQCVGDTLAIGGIMYGMRNIPAILNFCKDMREVSSPDCLFLNYANPMAMNTWAANKYGGVNTVGLCHGVQGGHWQICSVIEHVINKGKRKNSKNWRKIDRSEVDIKCVGINHQTWYAEVIFEGEDWIPKLLEGFQNHPEYKKSEKVRIDMLKRFGLYSTESNGHLSEYVPWYRKRPSEIKNWISLDSWINGETGGYLRICTEGRNWFKTDFTNMLKEPATDLETYKRSEEHGSFIIEAKETGRIYRGHFNLENVGVIKNLPDDAIIEAPGYVDKTGINMAVYGDLPLGCAGVCNNSITVQRLAVEAAVHGRLDYLRQAVMLDPLTGAVCDPNEIYQMIDEMLIAQTEWLPNFKHEIAGAKKRFKSEKKLGTRKTLGAARIKTKSVAAMKKNAKEARRNAAATDKGKMTKNS